MGIVERTVPTVSLHRQHPLRRRVRHQFVSHHHAGGHAAMQKLTGAKILMSRRRHPDGFLAKRRRTGVAPVSIFPD
jgi:hypothetical protein